VIEFVAGSQEDPREGFARCQNCKFPSILVHYNRIVGSWVGDDGSFHRSHLLRLIDMPDKQESRESIMIMEG
jgi:hypothetical protein